MRRYAVVVSLSFGALLLSPGATGVPDVPGDPTPPLVTPVIAGTLGDAGWYRSNVTVNWTVVDPESIILSTTGCDARTLTADTPGTRVTCTAVSDGGETTVTKTFTLDKTAPAATATPSRAADANGWYNHQLTVAFDAVDSTSGLQSCSPPQVYGGPDTASTSVAGTCRDQAGNTAAPALPLKYDATSPQAAPAARSSDANGWYNHAVTVAFQGADGTSGVESCTQLTYAGPDDPSVALTGTCRDRAGNESASSAFTLKYDETAPQASATPSRAADVNGWHNHGVTVSFSGSDATSGLESCDPPSSYSGPDAASATVTGACRDRAGNVAARSFALKYDATAPSTSATPSRQPNVNGWFNAPFTVSFAGTDVTSGIASCSAAKTYSGPDDAAAALSGTCIDNAGNTRAASFSVKYDASAPQTDATPGRVADANGWYNHAVAVALSGADAVSGIDSCDASKSYAGPDSASTTVSGACRDRAGNSTASSVTLKYDGTAPSTSATPSRQPNANGWFNAPLTVSFAGTDAMSTIDSCDGAKSYSGPDAVSTAVSGACRDKAGNAGSASFALKYDATPPAATASPSRQPNANGWYNTPLTVSFAATDAMAGLDSCPPAQSYGGPDTAAAVVSGTCVDRAGNGALLSLALKYDATPPAAAAAPSRAADANGWYNHPLSVAFAGTDVTSGVDACTAPKLYGGPDAGTLSLNGSCSDRAGNTGSSSTFGFKYDATAPVVSDATAVRPPDRDGWYNRPVAFAAQGTDATAGIETCPGATYGGPDRADASVLASCLDRAGNRGTRSSPLKYDATGPEVTAAPSRQPDANGWYNRSLTVDFGGADSVSGLASCSAPESYDGPDSVLAVLGGFCLDKAGNAGLASFAVQFDATPPQVTGATPSRPPDANGWYNRPLVVGFQGSDSTSEIEACTQAGYAGPDAGAASLRGSCRDRAGNGSAEASFTLRYDGTAPSLTSVRAKARNHAAVLTWAASPDAVIVEILRSGKTIYRGSGTSFTDTRLQNGVRYRYTLNAYDEAHNAATDAVAVKPTAPLVAPAAGASVTAPVRLAWVPVEKATHYNVQVWRGGKIFSAWPKTTSVRLPRSWTYGGRRYRLTPGRYHWYVWPGYGRPGGKKYGPLLGSSSFVVRRGS